MNILVLGANGRIARHVVAGLGTQQEVAQTLLMRQQPDAGTVPANARVVVGDVLDPEQLDAVMAGQDIVYANLAGPVDEQASAIVAAMKKAGVSRLVFVTALGIYDEVPGEFGRWNTEHIGSMLVPYRKAADIIEASGLDYVILRPAWLTDADEIDYETTQRDEPFRGTEVSRKAVAELIIQTILSSDFPAGANLGVNKPGTDGDKPSFM